MISSQSASVTVSIGPGIVNKNVDMTLGIDNVVDPRLDRLAVRHFNCRHVGSAASFSNRLAGFFCVSLVRNVANRHCLRTFLGESQSHRLAKPASTTSNKANLALESIRHYYLPDSF